MHDPVIERGTLRQGTISTCCPEARKSTCNLPNLPSFPPLPIWPIDWSPEFVLRNQIL